MVSTDILCAIFAPSAEQSTAQPVREVIGALTHLYLDEGCDLGEGRTPPATTFDIIYVYSSMKGIARLANFGA